MPRPRAKELTERELEIMHVFWEHGTMTAAEVRDHLEEKGRDLAYTTVATLVKILLEKGFLELRNDSRPFAYSARQSFREVSGRLVDDLVERVFAGSRTQLLVQLLSENRLDSQSRRKLQELLREQT